ncbi:MAG: PDZ domain-containing protein [Candidatus Poribacteria bacterium]|nr:PDZ domain-containing protein [Candidatus Poribacteria bacterium]
MGVEILQDELGVRINKVLEDTPAQNAGLVAQDIITEFKGVPIHTRWELQKLVANSNPNTPVTIKIQRGKKTLKRHVILGERE